MTPYAPLAKTSALAIAVGLHAAVAFAFWTDVSVEVEGSAGAAEARIGSSFADLAMGMQSPGETDVQDVLTPTQAPVMADPAPVVPETAPMPHALPQPTAPTVPVASQAVTAPTIPMATAVVPSQNLETQVDRNASLAPAEPMRAAELAQPIQMPAQTQSTTEAKPVEAPKVMAALETDVIDRSLRPTRRPKAIEDQHARPDPKPQTQQRVAKPAQPQRGNSERNATAGSVTGTQQATAVRQGSGSGQSAQSGNAAASNYPGKVMRKISRVPRPRVSASGAAVIAFSIAGNGGLSGASISRSSGSAALDQAALRVVKRAAPFPPPPSGARTRFSIKIEGAG